MAEARVGFVDQVKKFPATFYVANTMEIFERMAWYGFFAVSSLYITGAVDTGGLGFTSEQRGQIQAIVPFILYLMPVLTGALADRYGYKKMFIIAYCVMIVAYYSLGQFKSFPGFLAAFLLVAVGAAIFKPVVVGTVARVTDETNSAIAFGIFYMMVNIGGFVGPQLAAKVRGWDWKYVFIASSLWAAVNLVIVILFYREPTKEAASGKGRSLSQVLENAVEVLGNLRFFTTVIVVLVALLVANQKISWFGWDRCGYFILIWVAGNIIYDQFLPRGSGRPTVLGEEQPNPLLKRMHCSNWRFALYLLILSGFWTSFNQIFLTMPEYIRDFTETRPLIGQRPAAEASASGATTEGFLERNLATINDKERAEITKRIEALVKSPSGDTSESGRWENASRELLESKVRITPELLKGYVEQGHGDVKAITDRVISTGRQVNPESIVNFDAGAIVLLQVLVSFLMGRFHQFTTMIVGMVIAAVGIGLSAFAGDHGMTGMGGSIWIVVAGIVIFAIGEMMASPTSQEYVGRIAPKERVAVYMGYYFISVALGNLFGGILSGTLYAHFARDMQRPDLMWLIFGGLMLLTAVVFLIYNKYALPRSGGSAGRSMV